MYIGERAVMFLQHMLLGKLDILLWETVTRSLITCTNKYMKNIAIREMPIKTKLKLNLTPARTHDG